MAQVVFRPDCLRGASRLSVGPDPPPARHDAVGNPGAPVRDLRRALLGTCGNVFESMRGGASDIGLPPSNSSNRLPLCNFARSRPLGKESVDSDPFPAPNNASTGLGQIITDEGAQGPSVGKHHDIAHCRRWLDSGKLAFGFCFVIPRNCVGGDSCATSWPIGTGIVFVGQLCSEYDVAL